uniref:Uncharacterized protein n=1 Tax=Picea sitchensis TaxID=3332 RepID=B8LQC1_PICSI|nr:unknown [Picea sitchensis]
MVRRKTQMKRIENAISRQVTFSKRRNGLLKKAYELSVLCEAEVGLMIFSSREKIHEFATPSMQKMLQKYEKYLQECDGNGSTKEHDIEYLKQQFADKAERIMTLESTKRKMLGEELASCSLIELNQLESQAERGLRRIRARKEDCLREENAFLRKKCVSTPPSIGFGGIERI